MGEKPSINKKTIAFAVLAVALAATAIIVLQEQPALAQTSSNSTSSATTIPQLKGSVSIQNATNDLVKNSVKVSFTDAANTALKQVNGGTLTGGHLTVVQGYLVYTFSVANYNAGTQKIVIVDAGNGSVLYTSQDMPLYFGGLGGYGGGCAGMGGYGFRGHHHGMGWGWGGQQSQQSSGSNSPSSSASGTGTTSTSL